MLRRSLAILSVVTALSALAPAAALAARVTIRVEGRTQTIFAPLPRVVEASNPLEALEAASLAGEFYYHVASSSFGPYVDQIGRYPAAGAGGWAFKVNGASPPVGADKVELRDGDRVLWYWATFGPAGGPRTLLLTRIGRSCYRVVAEDDRGVDHPVRAVLHVDGRRIRTRGARTCVGRHTGLVRATLAGAVRSNALR